MSAPAKTSKDLRTEEDRRLLELARVDFPSGAKITPMLRQWLAAKAKAPDAVLLFRMGDFYELFHDDAKLSEDALDLTVTTRDRNKGDDAIAMAGFPHHAAPAYIAKLIADGHKVAVCDQLEDPALARGIVERGVTRVVTPGMVLEDESLDARSNNFLIAIAAAGGAESAAGAIAALDLSTGEFAATVAETEQALIDEIMRLSPREVIVPDDDSLAKPFVDRVVGPTSARIERRAPPAGKKRPRLKALGALDPLFKERARAPALAAAEMVLDYVADTQTKVPAHVQTPRPYSVNSQLLLDATTRRHLDLVGPRGDLRQAGTLLSVVDCTKTALGGRRLLRMLLAPSANKGEIEARLDRVAALEAAPDMREAVRGALTGVYDLERLCARVTSGRAGPKELARIRDSLAKAPDLTDTLANALPFAADVVALETLNPLCLRLSEALVDEPATAAGAGEVFRPGFDKDLDESADLAQGGRDAIAQMEEDERQKTGITNLKLKYTRVFGYYLEVTRAHLSKVPADWTRKQTVATGERYVTEALARLEEQVAGAEQKRSARESELFDALRQEVAGHAKDLVTVARAFATIDAFSALAEVAASERWVRPQLLPASKRKLSVEGARHPVVEVAQRKQGEPFVASDLVLNADERQVLLVTGPNMAGKSTLMRQIALIQILAQAGSFVPADKATLSLCDRIFTRVGASDDLAEGRSTFMVEMTETAHILKHATEHSLVLLDEIGRGTSTFDGVSIAWSVAEHIHDEVGARTLFATHYHELCDLAESLERLANIHVVVKEWNDEIVFMRTIAEGGAQRSYGIQVARLAGLPLGVLRRAQTILAHLEGTPIPAEVEGRTQAPRKRSASPMVRPQMDLFGVGKRDEVEEEGVAESTPADPRAAALAASIAQLDVQRMTPLQALNTLSALADQARKLSGES